MLGRGDGFAETTGHLIETINPNLLSAAASVYCGAPQPLWFLGSHHSGGKFSLIMRAIELMPDHKLFDLALNEAVLAQDDSRVLKIVQHAGTNNAEKLFSLLLAHKVRWTGNWLPKSWAELTGMADDETRTAWFDRITKVLPAIPDDLSDLPRWLTRPADQDEILSRLPSDVCVTLMGSHPKFKLSRKPKSSNNIKTIGYLDVILKTTPPILYGTYDRARNALSAYGIDAGVLARLAVLRSATLDRASEIGRRFRGSEPPPKDWIGPA